MKNLKIMVILVILAAIAMMFSACSSPEMTSAKVYLQQDNLEKAKEQLLLAKANEIEKAEACYLLATKIYLPNGETDKALAELEIAEKTDPVNYGEKVKLEKKRVWHQMHMNAVEIFNEAIESVFDEDKDSLLIVAASVFEKAIKVIADKATYNGMVKCYFLTNDTAKVIKHATDAIEKGIFEKDVIISYISVLWTPGNEESTLNRMKDMLEEHPDFIELHNLYITRLTEVGKDDEAITACEALSEQFPSNTDVKFILAQIYAKIGRHEEAINEYEKVLAEIPEDPAVIVRIAEAFFRNKNYPKSEEYIRKYIDVVPEGGIATGYDILWKSLYNQGKQEEAQKYRALWKDLQ
jgi:tetratricopeptide (TPR) repeat protein